MKVINKVTKEVREVNEDYFKTHQTQFEVYVEPKPVTKRRVKKEAK